MKLSAKLSIATIAVVTGIVSLALAQENIPSSSLPADKVLFGPTGVTTAIGELKAGSAYGDFSKGRHGTFIRMPLSRRAAAEPTLKCSARCSIRSSPGSTIYLSASANGSSRRTYICQTMRPRLTQSRGT